MRCFRFVLCLAAVMAVPAARAQTLPGMNNGMGGAVKPPGGGGKPAEPQEANRPRIFPRMTHCLMRSTGAMRPQRGML
jgi:hypothetical protein